MFLASLLVNKPFFSLSFVLNTIIYRLLSLTGIDHDGVKEARDTLRPTPPDIEGEGTNPCPVDGTSSPVLVLLIYGDGALPVGETNDDVLLYGIGWREREGLTLPQPCCAGITKPVLTEWVNYERDKCNIIYSQL